MADRIWPDWTTNPPIWFEFNGESSQDYGLIVQTQPVLLTGKERVSQVTVPGRSGSLTVTEGDDVYDDITLQITCTMENSDNMPAVAAWLLGKSGEIRFANRPDGHYYGRVANQITFTKLVAGNRLMSFPVQFLCRPYFYLTSGTIEQGPFTTAPVSLSLTNEGNASSTPIIRISGGESVPYQNEENHDVFAAIQIGDTVIQANISGLQSLFIDCDAKLAYSENPRTLRNARVQLLDGEWPEIPIGTTSVSILNNSESGTPAASKTLSGWIIPNWRCI